MHVFDSKNTLTALIFCHTEPTVTHSVAERKIAENRNFQPAAEPIILIILIVKVPEIAEMWAAPHAMRTVIILSKKNNFWLFHHLSGTI